MPAPPRATDPGARFRRKYGLRTDRSTAAAVRCGLESGYPDCCVLFFVMVWSMLGEPGRDRYRAFIERLAPAGPGYIPCPRCLVEGSLVGPTRPRGGARPPADRSKRQRPAAPVATRAAASLPRTAPGSP